MTKAVALTQHSLPKLYQSVSTGSLEQYIHMVNTIPMLSAEEEHSLAEKLQKFNDLEAAQRLVMSHLRFVVRIARGFSGYGLALADLIQEGNIGLMKAVRRFDPTMGVRLVSFAVHWVKAEMHEFIIKNWRIVKIATTKAQRKLFFNLRNSKKRLGWFTQAEVNSVAKDLKVKPEEVLEMEKRLNAHDAAFELKDDDDEGFSGIGMFLAAPDASPEEQVEAQAEHSEQATLLSHALEELDTRSRGILEARWLAEKKATLHELAAEYSVSAERIRQLEAQAISQLRTSMAV